jgi:ribonuclease HII
MEYQEGREMYSNISVDESSTPAEPQTYFNTETIRKTMIAGVDEAGRGCAIGPMVICGVEAETMEIEGVKDSKLLTPEKREEVAACLKQEVKYQYLIVPPQKIDAYTKRHNLNYLEVEGFSEIIKKLDPLAKCYVDACDVDPERFKRNIISIVGKIDLIAEHKADVRYPIVSAASILAKVERDRLVREIGHDLGSGYPSDGKTVAFLRNWYTEHRCFPPFVRQSWETVRRIEDEICQQKLI